MATNVAATANGGTASASSTLSGSYPASAAIDGDRIGASWGAGGGWNDGTEAVFDDWLQVDFSGSTSINEIDVFTLQDNYLSPSTPTLSMACVLYGLKNFDIQYWTGSAWSTVPGGTIVGNTKVWTQVTFSPITTTKIRILVHAVQDGHFSRIIEVEAWSSPSAPGSPSSPSPATTATGININPTLSWTASGAIRYDVYFGTAASPPLVNSNQTASTYTPTTLSPSTTYFWKIVAKNAGGSTTGSIWSFTTAAGGAVASGLVKPTLIVEAELSGEGAGWTDMTRDVVRPFGVRIRHGIQGSSPRDLVSPAAIANFTLNNSVTNTAHLVGYYSPNHANCRSGWRKGIACRIRFQNPNTGAYATRFVGYVDAINPEPGIRGPRVVSVTLADWFDEAARFVIPPSVGVQVGKRWDEILTAIIGEMAVQPTATSFDVGIESYEYALDTVTGSKQYALSEFAKLASSEYGQIYQKADGTVRAEGRHSRLLNLTSVWTITENELRALSLPSTRQEIINKVLVTIHPKIVDPLPTTVVYEQQNVIEIPSGETQFLLGSFRDPVTGDSIGAVDVQTQVSGVDFIGNTSADGAGTDISSSLVVAVEVGPNGASFNVTNNNAATAYLTANRLYGRGIYDRASEQYQSLDSVSIGQNGDHALELDMYYQSDDDVGQGAADYIKTRYSSAFAQARAGRVVARTSTVLAQLLARDISDRVTITESVTASAGDYFINGEELRLTPAGLLEADYIFAPAYDPHAGLYWILGTSTLGTDTLPAPF